MVSLSEGPHKSAADLEKQKKKAAGGTWVAQLLKRQTLDFGSSHDLAVCGTERCAINVEPAWDSLSLPVCLSPCARAHTHTHTHSFSLYLKIDKH